MPAERLVRDIEAAPTVDPAALAEALDLLERARAEQRIRRGQRRRPPDPPPPGAGDAPKAPPDLDPLDPETRARVRETRRKAAHKGWATRWSNEGKDPRWARFNREEQLRPRKREREPDFLCKHLNPAKPIPIPWDRRAAALLGWKTRRAQMAGREG